MQTTYHGESAPYLQFRDTYGTELISGLFVAFNKGGEVKKGTIISVNKFYWKKVRPGLPGNFWWNLICDIKVQELNSNHISSIKNINSIIVI